MAKKFNSKPKSKLPRKPNHRYNWLPDLPDQRDFKYAAYARAPVGRVPKRVDLRDACSAVFDQGKVGSCTANALAGALEFLELAEIADSVPDANQPEVFDPGTFESVSRLFIYYNERLLNGTVDQDAGAMLRDGIKALGKYGACREALWKYAAANVFRKPLAAAYKEATGHRISSYLRLSGLSEMKSCLAAGFPFVFGFSVYESFESAEVARNGIMPMPGEGERMLGGHAVLAVGYDDARKCLIVRNSWGAAWGQKGYFLMPYAYVESDDLTADFWTVRQ